MKRGDKIRFKVVHYTQNRAAGIETDVVKEGRFIRYDGEYLVVQVGNLKLPYIVDPDSVINEENNAEEI